MSEAQSLLERELDVGVDDGGDCLIQTGFCNAPLIDEGEFDQRSLIEEPFASDPNYIRSRTRLTHIVPVGDRLWHLDQRLVQSSGSGQRSLEPIAPFEPHEFKHEG